MANNVPLIRILAPCIFCGINRGTVNVGDLTLTLKSGKLLKPLFAKSAISLDDEICFKTGEILVSGAEFNDLPLVPARGDFLESAVETLKLLEDTKLRFHHAFKHQTPTQRTPPERQALAFNKTAFALAQRNVRFIFLPDTKFEQEYLPLDPSSLECPVPKEDGVFHIERAVVTGARNANGGQIQFPFDGKQIVDVVISLLDRIPEVIFPTTLHEGQRVWKGTTRLSADVRVERGKIARVIGTPAIVTEE